jgi:CheY-like chemotaxis protein
VTPVHQFAEALIALATEPFDLLMTDMNMPEPDWHDR